MKRRIRIGNQTAFSAPNPTQPFDFALAHGFDAFEWFSDRKPGPCGYWRGWDESQLDGHRRSEVRNIGKTRDIFFTVHVPWQANPLYAEGEGMLRRSIDFASDIGAAIVNLHLYMDRGPEAYVWSMLPTLRYAAEKNVRISIENTPHTSPADFNRTFDCFWSFNDVDRRRVGMCFDIGHANVCAATQNDFVRYIDELSPTVPIIHMHVHENWGDADTHLTLFTGPAGRDNSGVRALLERLRRREYEGAMILEQWPYPPEMLIQTRNRLFSMLA